MTGMCFSRPFHTSAQAIRGGLKLLQWRWLFSDISASSGFKNYFKLDRRVLPTGGYLNMTEDQSYKSPSVSKTKHICLCIMVQLNNVRRKEIQEMSKMCIWLQRREAHMSAAGISHQRIIFWAAVIAAWTLGLFPVSPHPKKRVCLRAIEQSSLYRLWRAGVSTVKPPVQVFCMLHANRKLWHSTRLCRWSLWY